jgi:hypothetical protein
MDSSQLSPEAEGPFTLAPTTSFDRREALRRLVVGGAVVWTAPLISKTAFAASATSCVNNVLNWNSYAVGTTFNSATVNGTTITLSASSFYGGSGPRSTNRTIIASPIGGISSRGLRLEQDAVNGGGQTISLTFSKTVWAVSFTITDVDSSNGAWTDRVSFDTPTAVGYSFPAGSTVTGAGTGSTPFRQQNNNSSYTNSSPGGNVQVSFTGPLTTITLRFACGNQQGSNQLINFSNISFCA